MIVDSFTLRNVGLFKDVHLELKPGLTVVSGINEDAEAGDPRKSNAAGKSMLFTALSEIMLDANPILRGAGVGKDLFSDKDACGSVQFSVDGRTYRITKRRQGAGLKYDLERNINNAWRAPKDEVRTSDYARRKLWELCPITAEEFFTFFYVDSQRTAAFQRGTLQSRAAFVSSAFRLEYGTILDHVKARLRTVLPAETTLANLSGELVTAQGELDALAIDDEVLRTLGDLQTRQKKLVKRQAELQSMIRIASVLITCRPAVQRVVSVLNSMFQRNMTEAEFFETFDGPQLLDMSKEAAAALRRSKATLREWAAASEDVARRTVLQQQLEKAEKATLLEVAFLPIGDKASIKRISKMVTMLEDMRDRFAAQEKAVEQFDYDLQRVRRDLDAITLKKSDVREYAELCKVDEDKLRKQLSKAEGELSVRSRELDNLANLDSGCCPTCLQTIDARHVKSVGSDLKAKVADLEAKSAQLEAELSKTERKHALGRKIQKRADLEAHLEQLQAKQPQPPERPSKQIASCLRLAQTVLDLQLEMSELSDLGGKVIDADKLQVKIEKLTALISDLELLRPHLTSLPEMWRHADEDVNLLEEELERVAKKRDRTSAEISRVQAGVGVYERLTARIKDLEKRIAKCKTELVPLPALQLLKQAYSDSGVKSLTLSRICGRIEENMNLYAPLLLSEPTTFNLSMSNANMHVTYTRKFNGRSRTVDVRRLSGAESAAFNLLFPLANLPLVRAQRRMDLMILDEPLSHLDEPGREMFVSKFLPMLLKIVPKVIIISPDPLPHLSVPATQVIVRRKGGISTVETAE